MTIQEEFKNICNFSIFQRQTNFTADRIERKDSIFPLLAALYFSSPESFNKLRIKIKDWLKDDQSETILALAGYIYYLYEDFKKAKEYFLEAISLNPDNLDNWIDLAFALRHNGEYELSRGVLFNYDYVIYYYKYLNLKGCKYIKLKKLILEIIKRNRDI